MSSNSKPTKLKVLIISLDQSIFSPNSIGDSLLRFKKYNQHLQSLHVLVPTTKPLKPQTINSKLKLIPSIGQNKIHSYYQIYSYLKRLQQSYDLIVSNDPILGGIALLARGQNPSPKVQISVFGSSVTNPFWHQQRLLNRLYAPFIIWSLKHADSIRCDNSTDANQITSQLNIDPAKIITIPVVPSPQNLKRFLFTKLKSKPTKTPTLLTIGQLVPNKDYPNLIQAASQLKQLNISFNWIIAGTGPQQSKIESLIHSYNLTDQIQLIGQVPYTKLPQLYQSATLFVSTSYLEGLPRVIMEACLSKTPVVATNTSGVADLITDQHSGRVVPVKNPQALASAINQLLSKPSQATKFATRAHQHALKYLDFDTNVSKLITSWQHLTHEHSR